MEVLTIVLGAMVIGLGVALWKIRRDSQSQATKIKALTDELKSSTDSLKKSVEKNTP